MKKTFSQEYIMNNRGCYSKQHVRALFDENNLECWKSISIDDILNSNIPLEDKFWFVCKNTGLHDDVNKVLALSIASLILPIFEELCPDDMRPRQALEAARGYAAGKVSLTDLTYYIDQINPIPLSCVQTIVYAASAASGRDTATDTFYSALHAEIVATARKEGAEISDKLLKLLKDMVVLLSETN